MGEYAPDDQRDVHKAQAEDWREAEEQQDRSDAPQTEGEAQMGYGNARDAQGAMGQDRIDDARPDTRARADAARPLGES
ncbi:hypothetical protein [Erythrobacter sp. AP23]|uniref:hypothetical protein n=1 Tax=Erythrobacter sp. AP23 TaxID=499656 RepID=UPI00076DA198|nr:hypothetical protein [Erythrobacter sp. AP23]KWV95050.1 hypothetical protein ASS64_07655 [Erythrobacter sp. AP23]